MLGVRSEGLFFGGSLWSAGCGMVSLRAQDGPKAVYHIDSGLRNHKI